MSESKLNITKLTDSNYRLWYFEIAIALEGAGCIELDEQGNVVYLVGSADSETQLVAIKECAATKQTIVSNCSELIKTQLVTLKNASEMWRFLFSTYSGENYSRKLQGIKDICKNLM